MARFADRLIFDTDAGAIRDGEIRYFMFRADVFTTMVASLEPAHVAAVVDAFAAAVRERGRRSLEKYLRELKAANEDESALAETIMRAAPSLGWGVWTLEQVENGFDLTVVDSPFAIENTARLPSCGPIRGMLTAYAELMLDCPVTVKEIECRGMHTNNDYCRFTARINSDNSSES